MSGIRILPGIAAMARCGLLRWGCRCCLLDELIELASIKPNPTT
jgi:hypothetical protein